MKYIDLLGKQLKSDEVIDLLEGGDLDVIYAFDRLHENRPDEYWVAAKAEGVQMRFNEEQILDVLFFYIEADEGFSQCRPDSLGVPLFDSRDAAREFAARAGLAVTEGEADFLGVHREWTRVDFGAYVHHCEFRGGRLHRVTVSLPPKVPQSGVR